MTLDNNTTPPATKPQPVLVMGTITTVLSVMFGGLMMVSGLQGNTTLAIVCGVGTLCVGAANQGLAYYTRGLTVPLSDVGAYVTENREMVAGPAANVTANTPAVVRADDGPQGLT